MKNLIFSIALIAFAFSACKKETSEPVSKFVAGVIQKDSTYKLAEVKYPDTDSSTYGYMNLFIMNFNTANNVVVYANTAVILTGSPHLGGAYTSDANTITIQDYNSMIATAGVATTTTFNVLNTDTAILLTKQDHSYRIVLKR